MVITLLCEPRSGSTSLASWFFNNKDFTVLFEPLNPLSEYFINGSLKDFKYNTKHMLLKVMYYPHDNLDDIIDISDKIVLLYRENENEQIESFVNAIETKNWDKQYVYKGAKKDVFMNNTVYFKQLKQEFKDKYFNKGYFKISYEDLYYKNKFQNLLDYIDLNLKNENFPHNKKYRINVDQGKHLI